MTPRNNLGEHQRAERSFFLYGKKEKQQINLKKTQNCCLQNRALVIQYHLV